MLLLYFFAMLFALFSPMDNWLIQMDKEKLEADQAKLNSMIFIVDQLRIALPAYKMENSIDVETQIPFEDLKDYIQKEIYDVKDMPKSVDDMMDKYLDKDGFYIAWRKLPPHPGLAHMLVKHYSRSTGDDKKKYNIVFYNIGFAENVGGQNCLRTIRNYINIDSTFSCPFPIPIAIKAGALVLTDRSADPKAIKPPEP